MKKKNEKVEPQSYEVFLCRKKGVFTFSVEMIVTFAC